MHNPWLTVTEKQLDPYIEKKTENNISFVSNQTDLGVILVIVIDVQCLFLQLGTEDVVRASI